MVGLVQNQRIHPVQTNVSLAGQIKQAARRSHQHVDALFQLRDLRVLLHSAHHPVGLHPGVLRQLLKGFGNLQRQLAGGHHHHALDAVGTPLPQLLPVQPMNHRNGEGRRLARARLRDGQHVFPLQHRRNGLELNVGRPPEVQLLQRLLNFVGNRILVEFHGAGGLKE